jgi:putative copper resistance protein D
MTHDMVMQHDMVMAPPLGWSEVPSVAFSLGITISLVVAVIAYMVGVARYGASHPGAPWSKRRTVSFLGGIALVLIATESFIGTYDMALFADHMIQHLLLVMVAAGLFAMGAPFELATETLRGGLGAFVRRAARSKVAEVIGHPIFGFATYAFFIPFTHLTSIFNLMLTHMWVHRAEQVGFLIIGYLFWRPVVGIEPSRHPLSPGLRLVYLALAVPIDTFTGLALVMSSHEPFSAYADMGRTWGPSLLSDIKTGGSIMWIGGDLLMMLAMIPVVVGWVRDEDAKTKILDARLDAEAAAEVAAIQAEMIGALHEPIEPPTT